MNDPQVAEIVKRFEHFLSKEIAAEDLKAHLDDLFKEVSIMSIMANEKDLNIPHLIYNGMCWLKAFIEVLDIHKEYPQEG